MRRRFYLYVLILAWWNGIVACSAYSSNIIFCLFPKIRGGSTGYGDSLRQILISFLVFVTITLDPGPIVVFHAVFRWGSKCVQSHSYWIYKSLNYTKHKCRTYTPLVDCCKTVLGLFIESFFIVNTTLSLSYAQKRRSSLQIRSKNDLTEITLTIKSHQNHSNQVIDELIDGWEYVVSIYNLDPQTWGVLCEGKTESESVCVFGMVVMESEEVKEAWKCTILSQRSRPGPWRT